MNTHNETLLRDDLHALASGQPFTPDITTIERRARQLHRRGTAARGMAGLGVVATVTAAALTVGLAQSGPQGSGPAQAGSPTTGHQLNTGQSLLYKLASASAAAPVLQGRYAILSETDTDTNDPGESLRTSVIDTQTGASTTYQQARAVGGQAPGTDYLNEPATLTEGPDATSTEAWYLALSTDPAALRSQLLAIAKQQAAQSAKEFQEQAAKVGKSLAGVNTQPVLSDDDYVYQEADELLWSPLVQPSLRSALYKVLAGTNGFTMNGDATDPSGRSAIAMIRHYNGVPEIDTTYEDPTTGAVLAQEWSENGDTTTAIYQPATGSDSVPADPYHS
ncbi:MAG TPA: hypothetical protein VHV57_19905 [Acidimicrobiales bacterium]|jgi:hypothetical protein|nr:hypothetical protein [Acidimicrobiales bacterium]